MSQLNDEPTKVHVETAKTTPQGVIRHKKNFEIDRRHRMQYKPKKTSHVSWDLPPDPVQDLKQEVEQEMKQDVEALDDSTEEDIHSDDSTEEEESIYTEHVPDEDDSHSDYSDHEQSEDDIEEAIDIFTQKLKESGFSKAKINLVKKMLFNALD